jgi:hypothetical protein
MRRPTRRLLSGVSFEKFLWDSARGFLLEDPYKPLSLWLGEDESPFSISVMREEVTASQEELTRLQRLTALEFLDEKRTVYQAERERLDATAEERDAWRAECTTLLEQVEAWEPPTPDHHMLKHLMVQQLRDALQETMDGTPMVELTIEIAARLHRDAIVRARADTEELEKKLCAAKERLIWRNAWVRALNHSVPRPNEDEDS